MQKDSKLIAEAYFKKINEMSEMDTENSGILQKILNGESVSSNLLNNLSREELLIIINDLVKRIKSKDQDDETADRTDQGPNDKSAIDYAREDKAAAERDKWTQGQGQDGKFHF